MEALQMVESPLQSEEDAEGSCWGSTPGPSLACAVNTWVLAQAPTAGTAARSAPPHGGMQVPPAQGGDRIRLPAPKAPGQQGPHLQFCPK